MGALPWVEPRPAPPHTNTADHTIPHTEILAICGGLVWWFVCVCWLVGTGGVADCPRPSHSAGAQPPHHRGPRPLIDQRHLQPHPRDGGRETTRRQGRTRRTVRTHTHTHTHRMRERERERATCVCVCVCVCCAAPSPRPTSSRPTPSYAHTTHSIHGFTHTHPHTPTPTHTHTLRHLLRCGAVLCCDGCSTKSTTPRRRTGHTNTWMESLSVCECVCALFVTGCSLFESAGVQTSFRNVWPPASQPAGRTHIWMDENLNTHICGWMDGWTHLCVCACL